MKIGTLVALSLFALSCGTARQPVHEGTPPLCATATERTPVPIPGYVHDPRHRRVLIFVHGLTGNAVDTWTAPNGTYWPQLVASDERFRDFDVYVYEYATELFKECLTVQEVARQLETRLDAEQVIDRHDEVFFVAHSQGGLIVRHLVLMSKPIADKTKKIVYFGTPIAGAKAANRAAPIAQCRQVADLRTIDVNPFLAMHAELWARTRKDVPTHCAYEKHWWRVVSQESATYQCGAPPEPLLGSHAALVKPECERSQQHAVLVSALKPFLAIDVAPQPGGPPRRPRADVRPIVSEPILDVAMGADGKTIAYTKLARPGRWEVWRKELGAESATLLFASDVQHESIVVAPNGDIWVQQAGGVARVRSGSATPERVLSQFNGLQFHRDGRRLLGRRLLFEQRRDEVVVADIASGTAVVEYEGPAGSARQAAWGPGPHDVALVGDRGARLLDLQTRRETAIDAGPMQTINAAVWDVAGREVLMSGSTPQTESFNELFALHDGAPISVLNEGLIWNIRPAARPGTFTAVRMRPYNTVQLGTLTGAGSLFEVAREPAATGHVAFCGSTLTYDAGAAADRHLRQKPFGSAQARVVELAQPAEAPVCVDDGRIFFLSRGSVAAIDAAGAPRTIVPSRDVTAFALSPDRQWIAYIAAGFEKTAGVYVCRIDGTDDRLLAEVTTSQLAFLGSGDVVWIGEREAPGLWLAPISGGTPLQVIKGYVAAVAPSPDGSFLVAAQPHSTDADVEVLVLRKPAGQEGVLVEAAPAPGPIAALTGLAITRDARTVVYTREVGYDTRQVWTFDRVTLHARPLGNAYPGTLMTDVAVSADGKQVAVAQHHRAVDAVLITIVR